jgi:hypothetical protein
MTPTRLAAEQTDENASDIVIGIRCQKQSDNETIIRNRELVLANELVRFLV